MASLVEGDEVRVLADVAVIKQLLRNSILNSLTRGQGDHRWSQSLFISKFLGKAAIVRRGRRMVIVDRDEVYITTPTLAKALKVFDCGWTEGFGDKDSDVKNGEMGTLVGECVAPADAYVIRLDRGDQVNGVAIGKNGAKPLDRAHVDEDGIVYLEFEDKTRRWFPRGAVQKQRKRKREGDREGVLQRLWDDREFTDCVVVSSCGAKFPAHRSVLSAVCPVLRAELGSGMRESTQRRFTVDAPAPVVEAWLEFLYKGELADGVDCAALIGVADKYMLTDLVKICADGIADDADETNIVAKVRALRPHRDHAQAAPSWGRLLSKTAADPKILAAALMSL